MKPNNPEPNLVKVLEELEEGRKKGRGKGPQKRDKIIKGKKEMV